MKKVQSGQGATDFGALDHIHIEPTQRVQGATSGERPTEVRLLGDPEAPISSRLAEIDDTSLPLIHQLIDEALDDVENPDVIVLGLALRRVVEYLESR